MTVQIMDGNVDVSDGCDRAFTSSVLRSFLSRNSSIGGNGTGNFNSLESQDAEP